MYKKIRISLIGLALLFISINLLNQSAGAQGTSLTLAIIGDYGMNNSAEASVAALVKSWNPELILTTGDDYYASAGGTGADKYDLSTGAYFCEYLRDITTTGTLCPAGQSSLNRFFPTLGNHDYYDAGLSGTLPATYLNYFTLPGEGYTNSSGNERYYDFSYGPIHFFMLNSLQDEYLSDPDGATSTSAQAAWLRTQLAASTATWNIVLFHHPPYSSGYHGSSTWMQWPFAEWGADAVLSGHDHLYERLLVDGIVYMINGAGGSGLYPFNTPLAESVFRYNSNYGAQKITASDTTLTFEFFSIENGGQLIDSVTLAAPGVTLTPIPPTLTPTAPPNSGSLDLRIAASADDIEQRLSDGAMYLTSSDLELVNDPYYFGDQNVGLRFNNVAIPQGATITNAFIEFEAKETAGETTALVIALQAADNAPAFTTAPYNLTSRPLTTASVAWNLPAWTVIGSKQTTPSLATPLQEVINRPGWVPGNSLVVLFSGSGRRTAWAWEGKSASAALLHIEYTSSAIPTASSTPTVTGTATITATATGTSTLTTTPTATITATPSSTPTATITATPSSTPTATETATIIATVTATETATIIATATATPTATGTATITATATPAGMHISDLDASSSRQLTRWTARVTVTVRSAGNQVLSGVTVTATWSAGANGTVSCTTNNSGICTLSKSNLSLTTASVTFKVTRLTKTGWIYQPTANQDPEGDSNGTDIIVTRP